VTAATSAAVRGVDLPATIAAALASFTRAATFLAGYEDTPGEDGAGA